MNITLFRISKFPILVQVLKNNIPPILNRSYPIAEQVQISFKNDSGFKGEFLDQFEIEVSEDGSEWSNPAIIFIKELVSINTPESISQIIEGQINSLYNIRELNKLPINDSTDRIEITSIRGMGSFRLASSILKVGDEIFMSELHNIIGQTLSGSGEPYMAFDYCCGNHVGYNRNEKFTLAINISSLANFVPGIQTGTNNVFQSVKIEGGSSNKTEEITVNVTGNMLNSENSRVVLNYNSNQLIITEVGTYNIDVILDSLGNADIEVLHDYSQFGNQATSNVELELVNTSYTSSIEFENISTTNGSITDYRSEFENDGYVYAGWNDSGLPVISRTKNSQTLFAQNLVELESDWENRLTLIFV